jgi:hypothetical protein
VQGAKTPRGEIEKVNNSANDQGAKTPLIPEGENAPPFYISEGEAAGAATAEPRVSGEATPSRRATSQPGDPWQHIGDIAPQLFPKRDQCVTTQKRS